jgi:hypothetical protein
LAEAFSAAGVVGANEAAKINAEFEAVRGEIRTLYSEWEKLSQAVES